MPGLGRFAWPLSRLAFRAAVKPPTGSGPSQVDERRPERRWGGAVGGAGGPRRRGWWAPHLRGWGRGRRCACARPAWRAVAPATLLSRAGGLGALAPGGVIAQRVCVSFPPPQSAAGQEHGFRDGVVHGGELYVQRCAVRGFSVSAAGTLPHLQDHRDRRLQCGQNVPDLPLLRRPLPRPHRGYYRRGFPRTSSGD